MSVDGLRGDGAREESAVPSDGRAGQMPVRRTRAITESGVKEQAFAGILWMGGGQVATRALDQLFTLVLVRLLAPGDFGLLAMAGVFTSLMRVFASMGIARAVVQRAEVDEDYLSTAFWGNFFSGLALFAIALAASVPIARFFDQPLVQPVFAALAFRFVVAGANATHEAVLSRRMRYDTLTRRQLLGVFIGGVTGVTLAAGGAGVWSLVAQSLTTLTAGTVLLWLATPWRPRRRFVWRKFQDLWSFGSRLLGARIFNYAIKQGDNLLIGKFLGPTLLGYYAFGYALFLTPLLDIASIVGNVAFSAFSRLQGDLARLRQGFLLLTRYLSLLVFPALVGLFFVAPDLVEVAFGRKWLPVVPVLRVLLVAGLLQSQGSAWTSILAAMGRADWLLRWSIASALLYVPAFAIGLRWGIVGVASAYTASTLILVPVQFTLLRRLLGLGAGDYLSTLRPLALATLVMGASVSLTQAWLGDAAPAARLAGAVVVGVLAYAAVIMLTQRAMIATLFRLAADLRRPARLAQEGAA